MYYAYPQTKITMRIQHFLNAVYDYRETMLCMISILYVSNNCTVGKIYAVNRYQSCCGCVWCNITSPNPWSRKVSRKTRMNLLSLQVNYYFYGETFGKTLCTLPCITGKAFKIFRKIILKMVKQEHLKSRIIIYSICVYKNFNGKLPYKC